jgi:sugar O-acyltransferase (sialic acid O-acetyltransferase NeuD family)
MVLTTFEMIIYGAGGHAKVVYDCLISQRIKLKGVFDDNSAINSFLRFNFVTPYSANSFANEKLIICIGSNKIRHELSKTIKHSFGMAIHKTAFMAESAIIEEGVMILVKSIIQAESRIGGHVIINTGAIVEHNCVIGDFAHIGPGAVVCGNVHIGTGTFIGANTTILPGISIGRWAIVGAGSVVLKDVADGAKVAGNPAKIIQN